MTIQTPDAALNTGSVSTSARLARLLRGRNTTLALLALALGIALSILSPYFLTPKNITTVAIGMMYDLLIASGMTLVMVLGGIDLSVGSIVGLTSVVTTMMLQNGVPIPIAIVIGLGLAILCGMINGIGVAYLKIAPFVVTLGMLSIARGIATVLTSGYFVSKLPEGYLAIGQGTLLGIPYPVYFVIATLIVFHFLLKNWKPLNQSYYVGTNPAAARLSGIRVGRLIFVGFTISGLMSGLAAIFMTSRLAMGFFQFGLGSELTAIAASVIGGASMNGGSGNILGTFFGVLILAMINNGFILLRGSPNWQNVVSGAILVTALAVDAYRRRKEERE
ncbi:MAG: ABC transporter permease [Anaerolineae bacterium]|nr:ABC transporter permease [Anaerolineae bacterium]